MLAGTIPVAAGVAYADRLDGGDAVVLTYNGEGSTAQGIFPRGDQLRRGAQAAGDHDYREQPVGVRTPTEMEYSLPDFARRADGYGIPGLIADGQDVFDVYDKVMEAVEFARSGKGPAIVELQDFPRLRQRRPRRRPRRESIVRKKTSPRAAPETRLPCARGAS